MPPARNMHATALILGTRGIIVSGSSGVGKTSLALHLVERFTAGGRFARLVSDDQVFLENRNGRLVCHAPAAIAGLVEVRGYGPTPVATERSCVVDLFVRLAEGAAPRLPERAFGTIEGCRIDALTLAARDAPGAANAILAHLGLGPFTA